MPPTNRERYLYLAEKWLQGKLSEAEELEFNTWYDQLDTNRSTDLTDTNLPHATHDKIELNSGYALSEEQLKNRLLKQIEQQAKIPKNKDAQKRPPNGHEKSVSSSGQAASDGQNKIRRAPLADIEGDRRSKETSGKAATTSNAGDENENENGNDNETGKEYDKVSFHRNHGSPKLHLIFSKRAAVLFFAIIGISILMYFGRRTVQAPLTILHHPAPKTDVLPGREKAVLTLASGRRLYLDNNLRGTLATQGSLNITATGDGGVIYKLAGNNSPLPARHGQTDPLIYPGSSKSNLENIDTNLFGHLSNRTAGKRKAQNLPVDPTSDPALVQLEVLNTLSTPKGANYHLTLSDGTKVWLNAASSISFPVQFKGEERRVKIKGEAYFEVAKNAAKPFKVTVDNMEVKVLGTHFNINAYKDAATINTTLLEGAVQVRDLSTGTAKNIAPGQQAKLYPTDKIKIAPVNTDLAIAWKNGLFQFEKADLHTLLNEVARWYNIQVEWAGNGSGIGNDSITGSTPGANTGNTDLFTGTIPRNLKLSELLAVLDYSNVKFKLEDNKLSVYN